MHPTPDLLSQMTAAADDAADMLRAMSNRQRLMILCLLAEGPRPVTGIAAALDLSQPYVSQQLARLRGDGLVCAKRDGRTVTYDLADARVRPVVMAIHGAFCPD